MENSDVIYVSLKDLKIKYPFVLEQFDLAARGFHIPLFYTPYLEGYVGGGTIVKIDEEYGILTAWHVAQYFNKNHWYVYTVDGSGKVIAVPFDRLFYIKAVDLAFIRFDPGFNITILEKGYFNLEEAANNFSSEPQKYWASENIPNLLHGVHSVPGEDRCERLEITQSGEQRFMWFPRAAFNLLGIDAPRLGEPFVELGQEWSSDFIVAPVLRDGIDGGDIPKSFKGTSGSALFMALVEINISNNSCKVHEIFLAGVSIEEIPENLKSKELVFRGPITLYESFLPLLRLKKKELDKQLKQGVWPQANLIREVWIRTASESS